MQTLMRMPNAPRLFLAMAVAGFGIFGFATSVLMLEPSQVIGERLSELTCLQVAFTPDRYAAVFLSFAPEGRMAIQQLLFPGDMVFAWGYGFLLAGLTGLLALRLPGEWQRWGALIMWAPLLASTLDCAEDIFLYAAAGQLIGDPEVAIATAIPLLAGVAAILKYLALSVITPAFGIAGIVKGLSVDRSIAASFLYLFLGLMLFSMILRPLQQIPPCF